MYYVLQFRKKEGVELEHFQETVRGSLEWWAENHAQDELVLLIGRTMRLGPDPAYMAVWKVRDLERIGEWQQGTIDKLSRPDVPTILSVAEIVAGGLYEDLGTEIP